MKTILNQILAGTRLDLHGERNTKEALDLYAAQFAGKRMLLNQQHDMSLGSPGYVENMRVVPDKESPGDWSLIGDVYYNGESFEIPVGGFSISFLEVLRRGQSQELFTVYLPYPYYNDSEFLEEIFEEGFISVGRWAKKAADPALTALVGGSILFLIKPVWEDLYKTQIAPHIYRFFAGKFKKLHEKKITANFAQYVLFNNSEIQVLLIPSPGKEEHYFGIEQTNAAMELVQKYLVSQDLSAALPSKMYLKFDDEADCFVHFRTD